MTTVYPSHNETFNQVVGCWWVTSFWNTYLNGLHSVNMKNNYWIFNVREWSLNIEKGFCEIIPEMTNPKVLIDLYKSVVLPSTLYGCEVWNYLKTNEIPRLNRLQHCLIKRVLKVKTSNLSDLCESIVGLHHIGRQIYKRKLLFLQELCMLDISYESKQIFLTRLFSYLMHGNHKHYHNGLIPDVCNITYDRKILQVFKLNHGKLELTVFPNSQGFETYIKLCHLRITGDV